MVLTCTRSVVPDYTAPCMLGHLSRVPGLMEQWDPANPVLMHYIKNTNYIQGHPNRVGYLHIQSLLQPGSEVGLKTPKMHK